MSDLEKSFPFDAVDDELGTPDRIYQAEDFRRFFKHFIGNGVYPNPSSNLQVQTLNNNMVVTLKMGAAFIEGACYALPEDMDIAIDTANASYNRKDNIVIQLDEVAREIKAVYKPGTASANPLAPELIRTSDVYELKVAEILVRSGTQEILTTDITDTRLDSSVCGVVAGVVQQIDTSTIFTSYQQALAAAEADIEIFKQNWQTWFGDTELDWDTWFQATQDEWTAWFNAQKANIFDAVYFMFENFRYRTGHTYKTEKDVPTAGSIRTSIINTSTEAVVATMTTEKDMPTAGQIRTTLYVAEDNITVIKTLSIDGSGNILEVIS